MQERKDHISSDLIRWLKLLALPKWAKLGLALIMLLALSNALGLLVSGMLHRDKDAISASVSILTVALPVGLIVVALVFGDGGDRKLREMTQRVLNQEVTQAIRENLEHGNLADFDLEFNTQGYITDYLLKAKTSLGAPAKLRFCIELNVKKVNVVFWIKGVAPNAQAKLLLETSPHWKACLMGAEHEGYTLNPIATTDSNAECSGVVFVRALHEDFLLEPTQRLYFAQDFAFFVRGMLEGELHRV